MSAIGIESSIHGYHVYWTPVIDEVLVCEREQLNIHDPFAVVEGSLVAPWGPANEVLES